MSQVAVPDTELMEPSPTQENSDKHQASSFLHAQVGNQNAKLGALEGGESQQWQA